MVACTPNFWKGRTGTGTRVTGYTDWYSVVSGKRWSLRGTGKEHEQCDKGEWEDWKQGRRCTCRAEYSGGPLVQSKHQPSLPGDTSQIGPVEMKKGKSCYSHRACLCQQLEGCAHVLLQTPIKTSCNQGGTLERCMGGMEADIRTVPVTGDEACPS